MKKQIILGLCALTVASCSSLDGEDKAYMSLADIFVWGDDYYGDEKVVDVNIRRLRMKIEDDSSSPEHLTTVWGLGYKWIP